MLITIALASWAAVQEPSLRRPGPEDGASRRSPSELVAKQVAKQVTKHVIGGAVRGVAAGIAESTFDVPQPARDLARLRSLHSHRVDVFPAGSAAEDSGAGPVGSVGPVGPGGSRHGAGPTPILGGGAGFPGITQTGWLPPDPYIGVGPDHIVQVVNQSLAFFTKDGTLQFSQILNSSGSPGFFESLGAGSSVFDPKCLYDQLSGRFVVVGLEKIGSTQSWIDIAVSDDSDPNGTWFKYRTDAVTMVGGNPYWVDYPGLGVDRQAIYVTANLFPLGAGGFGGVKYRAFDKAPMLAGAPVSYNDLQSSVVASSQCAHHFADPGFEPNAAFFVSANFSPDRILIQAMLDPLGTPTLSGTTVGVAAFGSPPNAPQQGVPDLLDTLDGRLINAVWRRGSLYTGHGILRQGKAVARWYELATNGFPQGSFPSLVQQGNVNFGDDAMGDPIYSWFPTVAANGCGKVALILARSSVNELASLYVTGREAGDPPGTMAEPVLLRQGTAGYTCFRWGDYFGMAVDPVDPERFWGVGEIAVGSCTWNTWIGDFTLGELPCWPAKPLR